MKFTVQMKDPDTLHDAIREAVAIEVAKLGLTDLREIEAISEVRHESISALCSEWFSHGEYLAVEVDTEAKTCTVIPK